VPAALRKHRITPDQSAVTVTAVEALGYRWRGLRRAAKALSIGERNRGSFQDTSRDRLPPNNRSQCRELAIRHVELLLAVERMWLMTATYAITAGLLFN
jgi:hypothetical protein